MITCTRCKNEISFFSSVIKYNITTKRCRPCDDQVNSILDIFRKNFLEASTHLELIHQDAWFYLLRFPASEGIPKEEVYRFIKNDTIRFLQKFVKELNWNSKSEINFKNMQKLFEIKDEEIQPLFRQIALNNIKIGKLPIVPKIDTIILESDEICYCYIKANFYKDFLGKTGNLILTNKKLRFHSADILIEMNLPTILSVQIKTENFIEKKTKQSKKVEGIFIGVAKKQGHGLYEVEDKEFFHTLLDTVIKISKRQAVFLKEGSRSIPQEIRSSVWQRDNASCVECGAKDYLELDHIIPFSKGGASTYNNLQILCRRCNLLKRDRI